MAEQVLVQVALHVLILLRDFHLIYQVDGFHQQAGLVDFALRPAHVLGEGGEEAPLDYPTTSSNLTC